MGGSTKVVDTTPGDIKGLRGQVTNYLLGGPGQQAASQSGASRSDIFNRAFSQLSGGQQQPLAGNAGGPQPGGSPLDRINAPTLPQMDRTILDPSQQIGGMDRFRDVNAQQVQFDPSQIGMIDPTKMPMVGSAANVGGARSDIRNVAAGSIPQVNTQGVDQLGGANSAFFQNMQNQLRPAFDQSRDLALAAAKESAGNLTGSGFANRLGGAVNRSIGDEQARLADYATQGMGMEVNRQLGVAGLNNQGNIAQFQGGLQAGMANQSADQNFLNFILNRGQLGQQGEMANLDSATQIALSNQGAQADAARLGLQAGQGNQDALLRAGIANQGADQAYGSQDLQRQMANQSAVNNRASQQGDMDQQRVIQDYVTRAQQGDANASRFLQLLLGMSTTGVAPGQVVQSGGVGSVLGPIGGIVGTALGGPIGGAIAGKIAGGGPRVAPQETAYVRE